MTTDTFHDTVVVMTGTLLSSLMVDNMQPGSEKVIPLSNQVLHTYKGSCSLSESMYFLINFKWDFGLTDQNAK